MRWLWLLLIFPLVAAASGDKKHHTVDVDVDSSSSTTVRDSSRAIGLGAGDVDINDCYRSYSVIVWQGTQLNKWCMANDLDARGLHDAAARMRCDVKIFRGLFSSDDECLRLALMTSEVPVAEVADEHFEEEEEYHEEQMELFIDLQTKIDMLQEELDKPAPAPVIREVEQRPLLTEDQADSLRIKK